MNIPAPGGFGSFGQGGARDADIAGLSTAPGQVGGYGPRGRRDRKLIARDRALGYVGRVKADPSRS